ncbi:MAG: hypothetical protein ACFFD4_20940 [Candidatus Odinarchaeota archaeon]
MTVPGRKSQKMQREMLTDGTNGLIIFLDGEKKAFEENKRALIQLKEILGTRLMNKEIPFRIIVNKDESEEKMAEWEVTRLFLEAGFTFSIDDFHRYCRWVSCKNASIELQNLLSIPDRSRILTKRGTLDKKLRPPAVKAIMAPVEELLPEIIDLAIEDHS